jgi:hypothetical protein
MGKGIVIAVDPKRRAFAVETEDGTCAVFCQHFGPVVEAGDIVEGAVVARGTQRLLHDEGMCAVVGDSAPLARQDALVRIHGSGVVPERPTVSHGC